MAEKLVNGKILELARTKITSRLEKKLTRRDRDFYELMELFVMFFQDDHPKVSLMWQVFRPALWVVVVMGGAFLAAVATGRVMITFSP